MDGEGDAVGRLRHDDRELVAIPHLGARGVARGVAHAAVEAAGEILARGSSRRLRDPRREGPGRLAVLARRTLRELAPRAGRLATGPRTPLSLQTEPALW